MKKNKITAFVLCAVLLGTLTACSDNSSDSSSESSNTTVSTASGTSETSETSEKRKIPPTFLL